MADTSPLKTDFPITIGGKQYTLSYPIEALWAYEDESGEKLFDETRTKEEIQEAYEKLPVRARMKRTTALLWAGLITHHSDITIKEVGRMVHLREFSAIQKAVQEAFAATLPSAEDVADPLAETKTQA